MPRKSRQGPAVWPNEERLALREVLAWLPDHQLWGGYGRQRRLLTIAAMMTLCRPPVRPHERLFGLLDGTAAAILPGLMAALRRPVAREIFGQDVARKCTTAATRIHRALAASAEAAACQSEYSESFKWKEWPPEGAGLEYRTQLAKVAT